MSSQMYRLAQPAQQKTQNTDKPKEKSRSTDEKSVEEEITDKMDENWAEIEKEIYTNFVTNV